MRVAKTLRYIVIVLLILVVLSSLATTGIFAKFTSSTSGSDSARVAKWSVDVTDELSEIGQTGQTVQKSINPNSPKKNFKFTATNTKNGVVCETLTKYGVTVNVGQTLPQGVSLYINPDENDGDSTRITGTLDPTSHTIKFTNTNWKFQPAVNSTQILYLFFVMDPETCKDAITIPNIQVTVNYEQAQS